MPKKDKGVQDSSESQDNSVTPEENAEEGGGRKKKKKLLLILIIVFAAVIIVAGLIIALVLKRGKTEKPPEPPAWYFSKEEEVSSVTTLLGERGFELIEQETEAETDSASQAQESTGQESSAGADEGEETASSAEEETETLPPPEKYRYYPEEDVETDLDAYIEYLKSEKGFIDVTPQEEPADDKSAETGTGETAADDTEDSLITCLTGPSMNAENYLSIVLEGFPDSYTVTASIENEPWNTYFNGLWEDQKKELKKAQNKPPAEQKTSREKAEDNVISMDSDQLGLSSPVSDYQFITDPGLVTVEDKNYYSVTAYRKKDNGTVTFETSFLLDYETGKVVCKYNRSTNEIMPLG